MPPSLPLHVPFSSTFRETQPVTQHRYTGIIEHFFSKSVSYSDFDSVLVYPSNLTNIIMTSTLWTSFNSKKMLTKHLNDARRCKKMMQMCTETCQPWRPYCFPILRRLVDFYKFLQYRGCIVGLLCGCSLRHYSW